MNTPAQCGAIKPPKTDIYSKAPQCHEDAAGFEVAWVGEAVGAAPQHLEQV